MYDGIPGYNHQSDMNSSNVTSTPAQEEGNKVKEKDNNLIRTDADIRIAVNEWCNNKSQAESS